MTKEKEWDGFGQAVNETVAELIALGLPASSEREASRLVWALGAWQGNREFRQGKLAAGEHLLKWANEPVQ